ncbi:MAG: TonB-dependent receptor [Bacteroidota bacterium]
MPATYNKNVTGLQVFIPYWDEKITQVFTTKYYSIATQSQNPRQWTQGNPKFSDQNFGYGSSLKFALTQNRFFRLSYENTYRIPESIEYFGDGNFLLANNGLLPEQSHNINFGFYSNLDKSSNWFLDINSFFRHINDQILLVPLNLFFYQYQNQDDAQIMGIEASIKTTLFNHLKFDANITWQDARRINIAQVAAGNLEESRLSFQPYFFTNLNLNYDFSYLLNNEAKLSCYTNYSFVEKYIFIPIPKSQEPNLFGDIENSSLNNLEDFLIPTQHLVNIGASCKVGNLPLWFNLEMNNLLNLALFDSFRIPKPTRNYQFKIRYQLK